MAFFQECNRAIERSDSDTSLKQVMAMCKRRSAQVAAPHRTVNWAPAAQPPLAPLRPLRLSPPTGYQAKDARLPGQKLLQGFTPTG